MRKRENDTLYRADCAKLCKVHHLTWDKYVRFGYVIPDGTTRPNKKWFYRSTVLAFKKKLVKKRKKGLSFFAG